MSSKARAAPSGSENSKGISKALPTTTDNSPLRTTGARFTEPGPATSVTQAAIVLKRMPVVKDPHCASADEITPASVPLNSIAPPLSPSHPTAADPVWITELFTNWVVAVPVKGWVALGPPWLETPHPARVMAVWPALIARDVADRLTGRTALGVARRRRATSSEGWGTDSTRSWPTRSSPTNATRAVWQWPAVNTQSAAINEPEQVPSVPSSRTSHSNAPPAANWSGGIVAPPTIAPTNTGGQNRPEAITATARIDPETRRRKGRLW